MKHSLAALIALMLASSLSAERAGDAVQISERKQGAATVISARNSNADAAWWVELDLPRRDNLQADRSLPVREVLRPGEERVLCSVSPIDPHRGSSYALSATQGFGDPNAQHNDSVAYVLPWEHGQKHGVGQGYFGSFSHTNMRALDFEMDEGTTICAARAGVIVAVKDDSDKGGNSSFYAREGNYIDILHDDGTWATYAHLVEHGSFYREGYRVKAGDPIALSGATGMATGPHLHFSVNKAVWGSEATTIPTRFYLNDVDLLSANEGDYLYSWHPGGPPFERVDAAAIDEHKLEGVTRTASPGKLSFREDKVDNRVFIYCVNGTPHRVELTADLAEMVNAVPSKPLPLTLVIPALSEEFVFSVTMKGAARYRSRYSYRPLRD